MCVLLKYFSTKKRAFLSLYFHSVHSYLIITCLQHASNELFSLSISLWMNECLTKVYSINLKIRESGKTRKWIVRKVLVDIVNKNGYSKTWNIQKFNLSKIIFRLPLHIWKCMMKLSKQVLKLNISVYIQKLQCIISLRVVGAIKSLFLWMFS